MNFKWKGELIMERKKVKLKKGITREQFEYQTFEDLNYNYDEWDLIKKGIFEAEFEKGEDEKCFIKVYCIDNSYFEYYSGDKDYIDIWEIVE